MKQHITPKQLDELTNEQREKLFKWQGKKHYPLLYFSIGQMIEFLRENHDDDAYQGFEIDLFGGNRVLFDEQVFVNIDELADALWEAVKEVL